MVLDPDFHGVARIALEFPSSPSPLLATPPVDGLTSAWLASLAAAGRSRATLRAYLGDARAFQRWAVANAVPSWAEVDDAKLAAFVAAEHAREVGLRLISRRIGLVRAILDHGRRLGHKLAEIHLRTGRSLNLSEVASPADIANVIRLCRGPDFFATRDRAVLEVLYGTGVAAGELCRLDVDAIDLHGALLRVDGPYPRCRRIPINAHAMEALRAWLAIRRTISAPGHALALFTSSAGYRIGLETLATICARRSALAGVVPVLTPRSIRNSFGVHLFENGAEEHDVAALMGLSFRRVVDLHRSTNPHRRRDAARMRQVIDREGDP